MKLSTELKKATQECQYAEKMAHKWTEKAERKREKVTELENLAKLDLLQKKQVSLDDLEKLLEQLPSPTGRTPSKEEEQPQIGDNKEETFHENTTKE